MTEWRKIMQEAETAEETARRLRERALNMRCPAEAYSGAQCEEDRGHSPATPHRCTVEW